MAESWVDKYNPKSLEQIAGQNKGLKKLKKWYKNWNSGDKPALLYGPPGTGKTAVALALSNDEKLEIVEINASDKRNRKNIEEIVGNATQQRSLLGKSKLILIDEVDGLSGRADRGGVGAISKLIKKSKFPIIMTANDPYDKKLRYLRKKCKLINFGKVHLSSMTARLAEICRKEGIKAERKLLKRIARSANGDLRSAINDLEGIARGKDKLRKKDLDAISYRGSEEKIFNILKVIFKTKTVSTAIDIMKNTHKDPDEIYWWLEQNIPNEYEKNEEVWKALDYLSKSDVFRRRIRRRQNWALLKYVIDLMAGGVALSKKEKYRKFTKYRPPQRLIRYGKSKATRKNIKNLSKKIGNKVHCSSKIVKASYLPMLKVVFEKNKEWRKKIIDDLNLVEEEIDLIMEQ